MVAGFLAEERVVEGVENRLERLTDQVMDCISLREREGPAVAEYLNELTASAN
jgi:hypothetical protein